MFLFKKQLITAFCAGLLMVMASSGYAQYVGPGNEKMPTTVSEIFKNPVDKQYVILKGRITKKMSRDTYEFTDASGNMKVTIDERHFFDKKVSDKTRVELYGEIEKYFMKPPIVEVERLTVLAR